MPRLLKLKIPITTKFICATEVQATIRFKSVCRIAVNEVYIIPIILKVKINGVKNNEASGKKGKENLIKP